VDSGSYTGHFVFDTAVAEIALRAI